MIPPPAASPGCAGSTASDGTRQAGARADGVPQCRQLQFGPPAAQFGQRGRCRTGWRTASGVLGTHIMDHASTLSAAALMPGFEQLHHLRQPPHRGGDRALSQSWIRWTGPGTRAAFRFRAGRCNRPGCAASAKPGMGADFKARLRAPGPWRMVLVAFADCVPRASNRLTLDRVNRGCQRPAAAARSTSPSGPRNTPRWRRPRPMRRT